MQKLHVHVGDDGAVVLEDEAAGRLEAADDGGFHVLALAKGLQFRPLSFRHGKDHPFLGLANPDFGVGQPFVLERGFIEPDFRSNLAPHLTHRAGKSARTAIGDGGVQAPVAGGQQHVHHHFLGDGVADLHGSAGDFLALARQFRTAEGRPVYAIPPGPPAEGHNQVVGPRLFEGMLAGNQADVAAEDQRVADVPLVEVDRPVDRGNPHPVAVVPHAADHPPHHPPRMQHSWRQLLGRHIGRGEAEDVRVANRLGPHAGAERIADDAADAGVGPAVGLDGAGPVMRLDLEGDVEAVVEPDDAGVVLEDADAPVVLPQLFANPLRRGKNRLLEHVAELPLAVLVPIVDHARQRFVAAMLAPGLGDSFELRVGRLAVKLPVMFLDGLHLHERQAERADLAEGQ